MCVASTRTGDGVTVYDEPDGRVFSAAKGAMNQPIVFVGGVHGVGKTTISRLLAERLSASHVTAGRLIREAASGTDRVSISHGRKAVPNVDGNQALLLRGLASYKASCGPGPIVLDGHFSLLDSSEIPVRIPLPVYDAIAPVAVVLVETEDRVVHARLMSRDGGAPPVAIVAQHAVCERQAAEAVCARLKIPLISVAGDGSPVEATRAVMSRLSPVLAGVA